MLVTALLSVAVAAVASAPDESWPGGDRTVNPGTDFFLFAKSPRDQESTTSAIPFTNGRSPCALKDLVHPAPCQQAS
jgi:hypothetical protein